MKFSWIKKGSTTLIFSLFIGIVIFVYFLLRLGPNAFRRISEHLNLFYIVLFFLCSFLLFFLLTWRARVILEAYGKKPGFFRLMKQIIAGYAVNYITPSARVGGEPIRIFMLKKEFGIDYRTGSASVLMDKFVEIAGLVIFGLIGVVLFVFAPEISFLLKVIVAGTLIFASFFLVFFYLRSVSGKGSFSSLFNLFLFHKIPQFKKMVDFIEDVETRMGYFFLKHKKAFTKSFIIYILYLIVSILEIKFLLLGLGVNAGIVIIIISLTFLGVAEVIPVPGALGFLEAGQSAVFSLFSTGGSIGFAVSIFLRLSSIFFIAVGFVFLSHFGWRQLEKPFKKVFFSRKGSETRRE